MHKGTLITVFAMAFTLFGCGSTDDCTINLPRKIPLGSSQKFAEQVLQDCGYTYSFDQKSSKIYSLKRGEARGAVLQSWSASISIDANHQVNQVSVKKEFTGP